MQDITQPSRLVPDNFLMEFELQNLKLSPYGALPLNLGKKEVKMVVLMFFIVKVLVIKVLLQPNRISKKIVFNEQ